MHRDNEQSARARAEMKLTLDTDKFARNTDCRAEDPAPDAQG